MALVTDAALAATPVVAAATAALAAEGLPAAVFAGVHPNPTTEDMAAGAEAAAALAAGDTAATVVAVGGGSVIDAAKGIALAAVNPQRGRALDYRGTFARAALPLVAVPTTAGTGAETNAFGVVTDPRAGRKFYVGHASTLPAAAILDPDLTLGLPPAGTAATGMDALTHALESYLSRRANPWSDGIALQVIRMVSAHLPRAVADGADREARSQMLLAAHLAGAAMASTGLGVCHAIGHSLGGRFGIAHGVALTVVLPQVLRLQPRRLRRTAWPTWRSRWARGTPGRPGRQRGGRHRRGHRAARPGGHDRHAGRLRDRPRRLRPDRRGRPGRRGARQHAADAGRRRHRRDPRRRPGVTAARRLQDGVPPE